MNNQKPSSFMTMALKKQIANLAPVAVISSPDSKAIVKIYRVKTYMDRQITMLLPRVLGLHFQATK